jgi:nitrate/nitrite transporter NarK
MAVISLSSGILSAFTTGYWGQVSDRVGRTRIMAVVETGLAIK